MAASRSLLAVGQAKAKDWGGGVWRTTDDGEKIFISGSGEVRGGGPNGPVIGRTKKKPAVGKPASKPATRKPASEPVVKKPAMAAASVKKPGVTIASGTKAPVVPGAIPDRAGEPAVALHAADLTGRRLKAHEAKAAAFRKSFNRADQGSWEIWTTSDYEEIRSDFASGKLTPMSEDFNNLLAKGSNVEAVTFRGLSFSNDGLDKFVNAIAGIGVGGEYVDKSPAATSLNPRVAFNFTATNEKKVFLTMRQKTGTYMNVNFTHVNSEAEVVSRPGAKYRVVSMAKNQSLKLPEGQSFVADFHVVLEEVE